MKSYLFLFFVALICCNSIEKKEINILEVEMSKCLKNLFASIQNIVFNCNFDMSCIHGQIYLLIEIMPEEIQKDMISHLFSFDCKDACNSYFGDKLHSPKFYDICDETCVNLYARRFA